MVRKKVIYHFTVSATSQVVGTVPFCRLQYCVVLYWQKL